jgi:hypothetical protein
MLGSSKELNSWSLRALAGVQKKRRDDIPSNAREKAARPVGRAAV